MIRADGATRHHPESRQPPCCEVPDRFRSWHTFPGARRGSGRGPGSTKQDASGGPLQYTRHEHTGSDMDERTPGPPGQGIGDELRQSLQLLVLSLGVLVAFAVLALLGAT